MKGPDRVVRPQQRCREPPPRSHRRRRCDHADRLEEGDLSEFSLDTISITMDYRGRPRKKSRNPFAYALRKRSKA